MRRDVADVSAEISDGEFRRQKSRFRSRVTADGESGFRAEPGRYHLYVSLACPWAHRTIIVRRLKGLEDIVSMSVVDPIRDQRGWAFTGEAGSDRDEVNGFDFLAEAYAATDSDFDGRVTVPVLWDRQRAVIVNNESADIIRMLNSEFDEWGDATTDLVPDGLRERIDAINEVVYEKVNNGVYRAGFATSQRAYERAYDSLFATLDELESRLAQRRFLLGDEPTEADWRLFTTLVRFDPVYHNHFRCNQRKLSEYPHLWAYTRDLYQHRYPLVAETVNLDHIKRHYYCTHRDLNPSGIVPKGPEIDFDEPHGRARSAAA